MRQVEVPDHTEPIRAIRVWSLGLRSLGMVQNYWWQQGVNQAHCVRPMRSGAHRDEEVPDARCACGFWGFPDLDTLHQQTILAVGVLTDAGRNRKSALWKEKMHYHELSGERLLDTTYAAGIIEMWGRVIIGDKGYRSEFARIIGIAGTLGNEGFQEAFFKSNDYPIIRRSSWNLTSLSAFE